MAYATEWRTGQPVLTNRETTMNRVDRLIAYLVMFQSRDLLRAQDLATHFEISVRTVYRDIDALSQVGVPIYGVGGEGYRLMEGYYLPPVTFSPEEARALALALSMFVGFSVEGETQKSAENVRDKIRSILPNRQKREVEALQTILDFYAIPQLRLDFDDQQFVDFQRAIHEHKLVRIVYHSFASNEKTERIIEPLSLVMLNRNWLLAAYCRLREDVRNFNLARVDRYSVLAQSFTPRAVPSRTFRDKTLEVHVQFDHEIVRWVRERQHFSFNDEMSTNADGVVMTYIVSGWDAICPWLLGWGDKMRIVAPRYLRDRVAETARRMVENNTN